MRPLKLTDNLKTQVMADFEAFLDKGGFKSGSIKFSKNYKLKTEDKKKAHILISSRASTKMRALVDKVPTEVGWNLQAVRLETAPEGFSEAFYIKDILVFPQLVNGAHFEQTEDEAYQAWIWSLTDEQFKEKKGYGHSHVRMSTTPSQGDEDFYADTIESSDDFCIFLITNKNCSDYWRIADIANNLIYEKEDIEVEFEDEYDLSVFLAESEAKISSFKTISKKTSFVPDKKPKDEKIQKTSGYAPAFSEAWGYYD